MNQGFFIPLHIYGQASGVPTPPHRPKWCGLVREGGPGGLACAESGLVGWVGCCCGRPKVTRRAVILRKPYANHKPYNVGRVIPVFINLNLYHPSLNPA